MFALLAAAALAVQSTPVYWGHLQPGPHAVGFRQRWVIDSTRILPKGEAYGLRYRPIVMNLWFPAASTSRQPLRYIEYLDGAVTAAGRQATLRGYATALLAYQRATSWSEMAGSPEDSTAPELASRIRLLHASPTLAVRDARRLAGPRPVIFYTSGSGSSMDENVALCEYLASHGYIVIGSAFPNESNDGFRTQMDDQSRQRDIRRLLLEYTRSLRGEPLGKVFVIGHSAGAQAMQLFASDPSAPIDAVLSLDTTQDYAMLTDRSWAYYTDQLVQNRRSVTVPVLFVADPTALFVLADSLAWSTRFLLTVPGINHSEYLTQGVLKRRVAAGPLEGGAVLPVATRYERLVVALREWIDALAAERPPATGQLQGFPLTVVPRGEKFPAIDGRAPRTAREIRHLFGVLSPQEFAARVAPLRAAGDSVAGNSVMMMLVVDAIRRGDATRARAVHDALVAQDTTASGIAGLIDSRAKLFRRIGATSLAEDWEKLSAVFRVPAP